MTYESPNYWTPEIKALVTEENVDSIIVTAEYGAITYWARNASSAQKATIADDVVMVFVEDQGDEEPVLHELTSDQLRDAYLTITFNSRSSYAPLTYDYCTKAWEDRDLSGLEGIETGHIDAEAADVIVQVACFGKVVYG